MPEIEYHEAPPKWLKEGAEAFVIVGERGGLYRVTIAKLTKRDIVLRDGMRFRHRNFKYSDGEAWYLHIEGEAFSPRIRRLVSLDSPKAKVARMHQDLRLATSSAKKRLDNWVNMPTAEHAWVAIKRLTEWVELKERQEKSGIA